MKFFCLIAASLLIPASGALSAPPAGTLLPVSLDHTLNVAHIRAGQTVSAEIMQNIPGTAIHRRDHVLGHVIRITFGPGATVQLEIRFDTLVSGRQRISITTDLRALASFLEVEEAQIPEEGASRGMTPEVATTRQIGGEQVYRGGGPVADGLLPVGEPTPYGVLAVPRVQLGGPCRADIAGNRRPQALWLFSTDACGVYGYDKLRIAHAGRSDPLGSIVLTARNRKLKLYSGTGLLLRVLGS